MYFSLLGVRRRRLIAALAEHLQPQAAAIAERWRRRAPSLPGRSADHVARLFLEAPWALLARSDFAAYEEHIDYTARRLAKLRVPLAAIGEALLTQAQAAKPFLAGPGPGQLPESNAALDAFQHIVFLSAVHAYDAVQRAALEALFGVLNAELEAASLADLLQRLLELASRAFSARWAGILLAGSPAAGAPLRNAALHGLERELVLPDAPVGRFFHRVLRGAGCASIEDAANDPRIGQPYFRALEIKSVWAAPLRRQPRGAGAVLGVLHVDFDRIYDCLPQERDLLMAFARRSTLAIERARLLESVRAGHAHIRRLSREVLRAQEDERRRIGRDLHDAAGQTFMATRLYLEMARARLLTDRAAAAPLADALASVDEGIAGLRRVIHDLAPVGLKEFGLAAALRRLARDFRHARPAAALRVRIVVPRRLPAEIEILAYRMAQEGLTNAGRHARARRIRLDLRLARGRLRIRLADDGVGMPATLPVARGPGGFGLTAMRERIELAGGTLALTSAPGQGTVLEAELPIPAPQPVPPLALAHAAGG